MLTLEDLKEQGFSLSKQDAQELHSTINHIAQRGADLNIVFPGSKVIAKSKGKPVANTSPDGDITTAVDNDSVIKHIITQEDIDNNPELVEQGIKVGDEIELPANDDTYENEFIFSLPPAGEHHQTKKKRLANAGLVEHVVTDEDIVEHPELTEAKVNVGDIIEIPAKTNK